MGAACCVAARGKTIPDRPSHEIVHRNVRYSPSWSFRWDNRRRVAGEVENSLSSMSDEIIRDHGFEIKSITHEDSTYISEVGSPLESLQTPMSQKSPVSEEAVGKSAAAGSAEQSFSRNISFEVKESPDCPDSSPVKLSLAPSTSSPSASSPLSSKSHLPPVGRTRGLKSSGCFVSEGRPSLVLPTGSNDSTRASHGGSSDSWSMQVFSELMLSSRRERWSFDSEYSVDKTMLPSSRRSGSPTVDLQTCGVCTKPLTERSSWSSQKLVASNELSVVAVLLCGHVYHAECLESMTLEINKYDPGCPVCTLGEKQTLKMCERALQAETDGKAKALKRSRNRIVDSDFDGDFMKMDRRMSGGREWKGLSSSAKDSFGRPFLKRRFSFGSKGMRSFSENETSKKKGFFWTRSSKE